MKRGGGLNFPCLTSISCIISLLYSAFSFGLSLFNVEKFLMQIIWRGFEEMFLFLVILPGAKLNRFSSPSNFISIHLSMFFFIY